VLGVHAPVDEPWLRQLWEHTTDAMAISDPNGVVLAANPAYYRLYGYGPEEVLGASFALIFPPEQREWAEAQYQEVFRSEHPPPVLQSVVTSRSGQEHVVESRVSFLERDGQRTAMLSIVHDVTQLVAAERAAAQARQNLSAVLFSLSHDIKSPLAVIKGYAQVLRRHILRHAAAPPPDRLRDTLAQIEASAVDVGDLVDEIVELAMLEEGATLPLQLSSINLADLVRERVERHERLANEHEFVLRVTPDGVSGEWDGRRLGRVLDNLFSNAVKYSPAGGIITVEVRSDPDCEHSTDVAASDLPNDGRGVAISVEDNGIGIQPDDLVHVFERFRRGSNVPETVLGSGVGLTNVEQIVRQHGGSVHIESQPGAGTRVTVWLPLKQPTVGQESTRES
jgi:PAS domain S-box-containing protein